MSESIHTQVLIIGSGPAGYTAAIYTARSNLSPTLISGYERGGQLALTREVENFPGFSDPVLGPDLMKAMHQQAENVGTNMILDYVSEIDCSQRPFVAKTTNGRTVTADSVIIATGAQARWLGIPGEQELLGHGVSTCATCDGFFFKNSENICIVGGGNTAVEDALHLSALANHVTLIHRRNTLRATPILQDRLLATPNITCQWNSTVKSVHGNPSVSHVILNTPQGEQKLDTQALFVAIGHTPSTTIFKGQVDMDDEGYIVIRKNSTGTNIPGIFAAGDVFDKTFRQAITAAASGCMAAIEAERFSHE